MNRNAALVRWLLSALVLAGVMFACAGRFDIPMMWAYLCTYCGLGLLSALIGEVSLDAERRQPGPDTVDPTSHPAASYLFLATVAVASLDAGRFYWTTLSRPIQMIALAVLILAGALQVWAMTANPFFSTAIRIQSDRDHHLIERGPYRLIRHPGYLAMAILVPATALALGSLIALFPACCYSALILWRTKREDEFLTERLAGYTDCAARVHCRLTPGVW